jgi:hypothetical protein
MLNAHVREQRQKTAAQFKSKFRVPPSNYLDNDIFLSLLQTFFPSPASYTIFVILYVEKENKFVRRLGENGDVVLHKAVIFLLLHARNLSLAVSWSSCKNLLGVRASATSVRWRGSAQPCARHLRAKVHCSCCAQIASGRRKSQ